MNYCAQSEELGGLKTFLQKKLTPVKYAKAQERKSVSTTVNALKEFFPSLQTQDTSPQPGQTNNNSYAPASQGGMSMPVKIGIGVGAAALVGTIIYVATRKKKK